MAGIKLFYQGFARIIKSRTVQGSTQIILWLYINFRCPHTQLYGKIKMRVI